jgi:hypothetical protein
MQKVKGNYIKHLQDQVEVLTAQVSIASFMNDALLDYAESDKFKGKEGWGGDRYVHIMDVIQRAQLTRQALDGSLAPSDYLRDEALDELGAA